MAAIAPADVVEMTDKLTAWWLTILGTDAAGYGLGVSGGTTRGTKKASDLESLVLALNDFEQVNALLQPAHELGVLTDAYEAARDKCKAFLTALDNLCGSAGITDVGTLDDYAAYYNTGAGGPWNCLFAPDFRSLYYSWSQGQYPSASNVYYETLQGSAAPNALRKHEVGAGNTADTPISTDNYAGGVGQIKATSVSGSGVVTVTGTWRKTDGTLVTAADGTCTVTGNDTFVLTPPHSNALLLVVTNITAAAGLTAGVFYAEAKRPTGRTNPPT